jgi:hypothetical protein
MLQDPQSSESITRLVTRINAMEAKRSHVWYQGLAALNRTRGDIGSQAET